MASAQDTSPNPGPGELDQAFQDLRGYGPGSARGALVPIDQAVAGARSPEAQNALEERLLKVLDSPLTVPAVEYTCSKLALVGSARAFLKLAELLGKPETSWAARNALEAIPDPGAAKTLAAALAKLHGAELAGAIESLGRLRAAGTERRLARLLRHEDPRIASAAATALGSIGTPQAGRALGAFVLKAPPQVRNAARCACVQCAEGLDKAGHRSAAEKLRKASALPGSSG